MHCVPSRAKTSRRSSAGIYREPGRDAFVAGADVARSPMFGLAITGPNVDASWSPLGASACTCAHGHCVLVSARTGTSGSPAVASTPRGGGGARVAISAGAEADETHAFVASAGLRLLPPGRGVLPSRSFSSWASSSASDASRMASKSPVGLRWRIRSLMRSTVSFVVALTVSSTRYLVAESGSTLGRGPGDAASDRDHADPASERIAMDTGDGVATETGDTGDNSACGATGSTHAGTSGRGKRAATIFSTSRVLLPDASWSSSSTLSLVRCFRNT